MNNNKIQHALSQEELALINLLATSDEANIKLAEELVKSISNPHKLRLYHIECKAGYHSSLFSQSDIFEAKTIKIEKHNAHFLKTGLPIPQSVTEMEIYANTNLEKLNVYPPNLKKLICNPNSVNEISGVFPESLQYIKCSYNNIGRLPPLPKNLRTLHITGCGLNELPENLPPSLTWLICNNNNLKTIPTLANTNLYSFDCSNNQIGELPNLPQSIERLYCSHNQITELPALPDEVEYLYCDNNKICKLPNLLPTKLTYFICDNNNISELPATLPDLFYFLCSNNKIEKFPEIISNGRLDILNCAGNPLPKFEIERLKKVLWIPKDSRLSSHLIHLNY